MAVHNVKCSICGQIFDRDKIEFVMTSSRRYAHKSCFDKRQEGLSEEDKYKEKIYEYARQLYKENYNKKKIETQLIKMMKENVNYTYSGVFKTLVYWYEVKQGDIEKSRYGIGIVPYVYDAAFNYYKELWLTQQINAEKNIADYLPKIKKVKIQNPKRNPLIKERHFNLLDEEEITNGI